MSNAIPLLEGTSASGGYLTPDQYVQDAFQQGIDRQSAVAQLARIRRVAGKRVQLTEYVGRPTAGFVAEGADKPATGAAYNVVTVDIKKVASLVMYTEELIEDAQSDPTVLVNQDVRGAISDLIDSHALGHSSSGTVSTQFNNALTNTTQTVEYVQANQDAAATAVSSAIQKIRGNGYSANGIIIGPDFEQGLRDARTTFGQPLYTNGFTNAPQTLYDLTLSRSTNLSSLSTTAGAGDVLAIVGDFSQALLAVRDDIRVKFSDQATVNVSGTDHRLWQQNKVAALWETRVGFVAHDLNRAFTAIVNAA